MYKRCLVLVVVALVGTVGSDSRPVFAQASSQQSHQHDTQKAALPIAVDGAKTPERVPDDLAYAHLLSVLALTSTPTEKELGRRKIILRTIGLDASDSQRIVTALAGVREQLAEVETQRKQVTPQNFASVQSLALSASLRARQQTILRDAKFRVIGTLSPAGVGLLEEHIQARVKPRIVIYGDPRQ